jgi:hypothetical protein
VITLTPTKAKLQQLVLDPNNFRFQDDRDFTEAALTRFHEATVQDAVEKRLRKDEALSELRRSILTNGFLQVERIVVRPYEHSKRKKLYVVVEGNRRVAALKWIVKDAAAGIPIPEALVKDLQQVDVLVVPDGEEAPKFVASLMGIRHVAGVKQWGGYQRSKLVASLRDEMRSDAAEIGNRLGMSSQEVNRRYRAYKALQQMQRDEEFGDCARADMYPIFHEALALPAVRGWLGWNETQCAFTNDDQLREFYNLITESEEEEGPKRPAKITTYEQVRELRHILEHSQAKRLLLDPARTFIDSVAAARSEELRGVWRSEVADAIAAIANILVDEIENLDGDGIDLLQSVATEAQRVIERHRKLTS